VSVAPDRVRPHPGDELLHLFDERLHWFASVATKSGTAIGLRSRYAVAAMR
jgi:hypothetical protein